MVVFENLIKYIISLTLIHQEHQMERYNFDIDLQDT